jgi:hypothetical protein
VKLVITIDTDNDAFQPDPGPEVERILFELGLRLSRARFESFPTALILKDINGNEAGDVRYTDESLTDAARDVVDRWESGDLAEAVRRLDSLLPERRR